VPDRKWGEVGCAVVVPAPSAEVTLEDIAQKLDGRLARYKIPRSMVQLQSLPRNALGKVDKKQLRRTVGGDRPPSAR
jgi:fatty-acyl-CoA synthase